MLTNKGLSYDKCEAEMISKSFKVDIHTHILPKVIPDFASQFGYGEWITLHHKEGDLAGSSTTHGSHEEKEDTRTTADMMLNGKHFRTINCNCWKSTSRLNDCAKSGVDLQVLSTVPVMFSYWAKPHDALIVAKYVNDDIANTVSQNPKQFVGLGTVPLQDPELAVSELKRCVQDLGFKGVEIGSHVNEWNLDAPELEPFWAACDEMEVAVFVHPWDMEEGGRMTKYWFPWLIGMPCETTVAICSLIFGGVLERYPRIKFCFAHGGGSFLATLGRIKHGYETRPDLCQINNTVDPETYLNKIWIDSLMHDEDALRLAVKKLGCERILLGTDYPFVLGEHQPGKLIEDVAEMDEHSIKECKESRSSILEQIGVIYDKDKQNILGKNAMCWLGLDAKDY